MSKVLVVFHSRTGCCRRLAQVLSETRRWSLGEVDYFEPPGGYWRCALDALTRKEPEIRYQGANPATFDVVVLVSPIWCWGLSPPMRGFVRSMHGKLDRVAVVSCMGGSGAARAVREVEQRIGRRTVARLALTQSQVETRAFNPALQSFADAVEDVASGHGRSIAPTIAAGSTT
ncbi:MAG: flavodoxin family protein [Burkholderiaceae bacterium]